jgi:hypothetical protein
MAPLALALAAIPAITKLIQHDIYSDGESTVTVSYVDFTVLPHFINFQDPNSAPNAGAPVPLSRAQAEHYVGSFDGLLAQINPRHTEHKTFNKNQYTVNIFRSAGYKVPNFSINTVVVNEAPVNNVNEAPVEQVPTPTEAARSQISDDPKKNGTVSIPSDTGKNCTRSILDGSSYTPQNISVSQGYGGPRNITYYPKQNFTVISYPPSNTLSSLLTSHTPLATMSSIGSSCILSASAIVPLKASQTSDCNPVHVSTASQSIIVGVPVRTFTSSSAQVNTYSEILISSLPFAIVPVGTLMSLQSIPSAAPSIASLSTSTLVIIPVDRSVRSSVPVVYSTQWVTIAPVVTSTTIITLPAVAPTIAPTTTTKALEPPAAATLSGIAIVPISDPAAPKQSLEIVPIIPRAINTTDMTGTVPTTNFIKLLEEKDAAKYTGTVGWGVLGAIITLILIAFGVWGWRKKTHNAFNARLKEETAKRDQALMMAGKWWSTQVTPPTAIHPALRPKVTIQTPAKQPARAADREPWERIDLNAQVPSREGKPF